MQRVQIQRFYACSKISLGSELFYACELSKYLSTYNMRLDLDDVVIDTVLKKSKYWNYYAEIVNKGLIENVVANSVSSDFDAKDVCNVIFYYDDDANVKTDFLKMTEYPAKTVQIELTDMDKEIWHWSMLEADGSLSHINHVAFNNAYKSQNLISLLAFVAVRKYVLGDGSRFVMKIDQSFAKNSKHSVSDILLLDNETNALKGWAHIDMSDLPRDLEMHVGYEAWWFKGFDKGFLRQDYAIADKLQKMKALGIEEGDVVGVFARNMMQSNNRVKSIKGFTFAIIEKITKTAIVLQVVYTRRTRYGGQLAYEDMTTIQKQKSCGELPDQTFSSRRETLALFEIGVEYIMSNELYFILPLENSDVMELDVTDGKRKNRFSLSEVQAIFWLLKEFSVKFNEERYRQRYLGGKESLYDQYMSGKEIPQSIIVK